MSIKVPQFPVMALGVALMNLAKRRANKMTIRRKMLGAACPKPRRVGLVATDEVWEERPLEKDEVWLEILWKTVKALEGRQNPQNRERHVVIKASGNVTPIGIRFSISIGVKPLPGTEEAPKWPHRV